MTVPKAIVFLAEGSEEMEAVITIDLLRRAKIDVTVVGLHSDKPTVCSRNVVIVPDISFSDVTQQKLDETDAVILPGGLGGAKAFAESKELHAVLTKFYNDSSKLVAAICAAPIAFKAAKIGLGKKITSHPVVHDQLKDEYHYSEHRVVVDGNMITSRGPGTAFEFAFELIKHLVKDKSLLLGMIPGLMLPEEK